MEIKIMMKNVDVAQVKQYNTLLKQYKDQATKIRAEIEFNSKELNTLCAELSSELGIQVTPENIEQVYNERVEKINSTLESGMEILSRVQREAGTV